MPVNIRNASNFSMKIRHEAILYSDSDTLLFGVGDTEYKLSFQKCKYSFESDDTLLITVQEASAKIVLEESDGVLAKNFISLTLANPFLIDEFSIMPEFSIGTFDDADFISKLSNHCFGSALCKFLQRRRT